MPDSLPAYSRRSVMRLGAGASLAALLAACGRGGGDDLLADAPDVPSGKRAGTLRLGVAGEGAGTVGLLDAVYSRLVALDPRNGRVYGDLAERFELTPDGLTASITLREGLRFHPDAAGLAASLTAEDVRRDFAARAGSGEYLFARAIEAVETPDTRHIVLRMRAPFSLLFDYLGDAGIAGIGASARYKDIAAPLGSGPFVPVAREAAGVALVANPLYHRKQLPRLERLQVINAGTRDLTAAVAAGEFDLALHPPGTPHDQAQPPKNSDAVTSSRASRRMRGLGFSLTEQKARGLRTRAITAMQDQRVRRAVSLALDRKAIADFERGVLSGPVGPAHPLDALPQDELAKHPLYQHNQAEARQLLAAAGVGELTFALEGANRPVTRAIATLVEKQLREVGFVPQIRLVPIADWERLFLAGDFEAAIVEVEEMRTPDLGLRLHTSGGLSGDFSWWGYSSPVFDAAVRKAATEVDPARRGERARAAQRVLLDEVPAMFPLSAPPDYATIRPNVAGYEFDAFEFNDGWNAAAWRLEEPKKK